jgi:hypothetical protein
MNGKNNEQQASHGGGICTLSRPRNEKHAVRGLRISSIDKEHCVVYVARMTTYARKDQLGLAIDFEVHYFVRGRGSKPIVFGWVSGDEQAVLKQRGLM